MGTELVRREPTQPALPRWSRSQIDLLKRTVAKGLTDDEMQLFVYVCRRTGLDPFLKQVHAIKRWDSDLGDYRMAIQTGIDGYRLQAGRNEGYAGSDPPEFTLDSEGHPVLARVTVYKIVNGERCAFTGEARWSEYAQRKKDGSLFQNWEKMPYNQLAKCAEAQALRKGFQAEVQGLMVYEEMPTIEGGGDEGAGGFTAATLYEGRVTLFRLGDPKKKRPGQIAVAVEGRGMLGPLGFWDVPEALKDHKPEEAVGVHVQISYAEVTSKKGGTYKNLSHLAVKPAEAETEPTPEAGDDTPPAAAGEPTQTGDPGVEGAAATPERPAHAAESPLDYWFRQIRETKTAAALKEWWTPFGAKGGRLWEFTPAEREKLIKAKDEKKIALGGRP